MRRDTMDAEALAEQEGRLPPIYENKTYPRATMKYVDGGLQTDGQGILTNIQQRGNTGIMRRRRRHN